MQITCNAQRGDSSGWPVSLPWLGRTVIPEGMITAGYRAPFLPCKHDGREKGLCSSIGRTGRRGSECRVKTPQSLLSTAKGCSVPLLFPRSGVLCVRTFVRRTRDGARLCFAVTRKLGTRVDVVMGIWLRPLRLRRCGEWCSLQG